MHGCGLGSALLVNAEVDSMGGVVDGGVGIGIKTSPRRAAIERAQTELRQEYDVREERRRELEFLEKGGNPLDFKFGNAASGSVESTSLTDHQTEHFVTSEAKGSFALTASPHGDSVESSGRPGAPTVCEPNSADNFDAENEIIETGRNPKHPSRSNIVPLEQSSQVDGTQNAKESEDPAIVRPYARRNRTRSNRDGARSSSTDVVQSSSGLGSLLHGHGVLRDAKGSVSETNHQKNRIIPTGSHPKSTTSNGDMVSQVEITNSRSNMEMDGAQALEATVSPPKSSLPENRLDHMEANILRDEQHDKKCLSEGDGQKTPIDAAFGDCDHVGGKEQVISAASECPPDAAVVPKAENENGSAQLNGFSDIKSDGNEGQNINGAIGAKGLDSESSCTQNSLCLDANNESDLHINGRNNDANGLLIKGISESEGVQNTVTGEMGNEKEIKVTDSSDVMKEDNSFRHQNQSGNGSVFKNEEEMERNSDEIKCSSDFKKRVEQNDNTASEGDKRLCNALDDDSSSNQGIICPGGPQSSVDFSNNERPESALSEKNSSAAPDPESCSGSLLIAADKAHEDAILEEARGVEAKRKRIAELPLGIVSSESRRKLHWDFVLEEMTWLANDFAQERLWKMTAASQICRRVAFSSRLRVEEQNQYWKLKKVAYTLAKAVMQFWHSAEMFLKKDDHSTGLKICNHNSRSSDENESSKDKFGKLDKEACKELESQNSGKNLARLIQGYAVRFLKCNSSAVPSLQAEAPATPDRIADSCIVGTSWEDHLTEESLFYAIPAGAMEAYRISIESHLIQFEKAGSGMQEEVETSVYDGPADFAYPENAYYEEDEETNTYYLQGGFEGSRSTKYEQKKRKHLKYSADFPYGSYSAGPQQNALIGKRPASNLHVGSIPTKRVRTTPRPRFTSPFTAGSAGCLQTPAKTDASSGDTSSFQDEQSTLHGGSQVQRSMEVESVVEQLPYDCAETSTKQKKKKKAKHLVSAYEGWPLDSPVHNEQRDNFKKRPESLHFDSNGTSGLYGQHTAKKPKIMKQSLDSTYDNMAQMSGSIPSPVGSQMSNMPSTNKVVKLIVGGRDRSRKPKVLKVPQGQSGPGSPWSLFEDQALVVLVHDMGPNWELVSDAINSTLQFKCIFRKPKECKERHKILMDKSGDGYDSADDSRTSQPYPSTLPGIPKGSARQLFQRLQGPMEEDTIKSHFEKIMVIGKKYLYRRSQNENQDPKQIVPVHNSHLSALDQVPTNQNGGVLTPLDLCDTTAATSDVIPIGYQSSHAGSLPLPNQGAGGPILPTSGVNSSLQASSAVVLGHNSPSVPLTAPIRDGRYNIPRTSLPADEQQRMQHYNPMMANRNLQQPNMSVSGSLSGADRGVRMLSGGNTVSMMPGMNRNMPLPRPGFQGMASSSMLNSGSMLSSGMVGMPSPVSVQSASGSAQGNTVMRSREGLHMMRAGHNSEHQRQMMVPDLQMQGTQASSQGIPAFNGLSSAFANQTTPPAVQPYPGHPQQQHQMPPQQPHVMSNPHVQGANHTTGPQPQAFAVRMAKERHMHQRIMQQQQQQFAASGALLPHAQPQSQHPISSSMPNSSQIQPQTSSQAVSLPPLTPSSPMTPLSVQQQQKHTLPHHGISRNSQTVASGLTNQIGKQRPRQPQQNQQFQPSGRIHPSQRQHSQSPQQAKLMKGMGRGNVVVHQNLSMDHSPLNGLSVPPANQSAEKGEQIVHLMQNQGLYSSSALSSMPSSKPLVTQSSNHSQLQQKLFSAVAPPPSKPLQQMPSHADLSTQGQLQSVSSGHSLSTAHQTLPSAIMASNHQHLQMQPQTQQKQASQVQPTPRMLQQNRQLNTDIPTKSQTDRGHTEQQPLSNVPQMAATTSMSVSQACNDSASAVPISSSVVSTWKQSEPSCDSAMTSSASQVGSIGSAPLTNSAGNEPVSSVNHGLGQKQLSGGLPQHGSAGVQWQQQPSPPQLAPPPPQSVPPPPQPVSQQLLQSQEQAVQQEQQSPRQQLPPQQHSHQHTQHLQSAQGSLYIRPTNSQME